jgi:hypothetical protein
MSQSSERKWRPNAVEFGLSLALGAAVMAALLLACVALRTLSRSELGQRARRVWHRPAHPLRVSRADLAHSRALRPRFRDNAEPFSALAPK